MKCIDHNITLIYKLTEQFVFNIIELSATRAQSCFAKIAVVYFRV